MAITVVIPVYNQAYPLSLTLSAFTRQVNVSAQLHVVVVDDGSAEPISAVVEAYRSRLNLTYVRLPRVGRAAARNAGARWAKNGIIVFNDADRMPRPDFLAAHIRAHNRSEEAIVVGQVREMYIRDPEQNRGRIMDALSREALDRVPQYCRLVYSLYDEGGATGSPIAWVSTLSGNLSLPIELFWRLQGFDERFEEWGFEHMELGYRASQAGVRFRYQKQAVNVHLAHSRGGSYETYMRRSHAVFYAKHPSQEVRLFLDFMLGEASLRDLEHFAAETGPAACTVTASDGYVKITNFRR